MMRGLRVGVLGVLLGILVSVAVAAPAFASSGVWWGVSATTWPSALTPEKQGIVNLYVQNRGYEAADGTSSPVVVRDVLPAGLTASAIVETRAGEAPAFSRSDGSLRCVIAAGGHEVQCFYEGEYKGAPRLLAPYMALEARIAVAVQAGAASGEESTVSVSGGGASGETAIAPKIQIGAPPRFGIAENQLTAEAPGGESDRQAGSHPFQLTDTLALDVSELYGSVAEQEPGGMAKDLTFKLPPGLLGNPTVIPQCTAKQFTANTIQTGVGFNECPSDTAIGVASTTYNAPGGANFNTELVPLFNLTPLPGEPARFGFEPVTGARIYLETSVRTGSDYGVTVRVPNLPQLDGLFSSRVTFWGVPGAAIHDPARGWACVFQTGECAKTEVSDPPPLLSMPTSCSGPMPTSAQADSWEEPLPANPLTAPLFSESQMPGMLGCNHLQFEPQVSVSPDVPNAATPTGLEVKVHVPQAAVLNAESDAEGTIRNTVLALPAGVNLNPGGGDGLEACSEQQIGFEGSANASEEPKLFSASLPEPLDPGVNFCPNGAKVATVAIETPLLPNPLTGAVYLAQPAALGEAGRNPFDKLVAMYIVAKDPVSGTLVKLPGRVLVCEKAGEVLEGFSCEASGQLVSSFTDTPQLPFENLVLHFFGGARAPLTTPGLCGSYVTHATFTPWSAEPGEAAHTATSSFDITAGPRTGNGPPSACPPSPRPFSPEFETEMINPQAGANSELRTTMGHPDVDQPLGALSITLPPGVMGSLAHVKLCGEPQANEGTCGPESLIGQTTVTAGFGSSPLVVKRPGSVYITGPYNGHGSCTVGEPGCAPFGLSIANPAEAGPFDLAAGTACNCVVVRAKVEVDPHTAQLRITSGALPTRLRGIPLDLQHVSVQINRPDFAFNPTSCSRMSVTGSMSGGEGASVPIATPFQALGCGALPFTPIFKATTSAHHTRKQGASLHVLMRSSPGQANIREVHVELPVDLPSELKTLQHACTEAQFNANPAGCPAESVVGHALVHTPVLPVPLEGPAYFVSHAGQGFPELTMVLQGYGVTVILNGETFIAEKGPHKGVTSTTFKTVPDVPFNTFELTLPAGEHSALAGNGNFCKEHLRMPIRMIAQSGKRLEKTTTVAVRGCKPAIYIIKKKTRGQTAHLIVQVPSAGRLLMTGKGIRRQSRTASKAERMRLTVRLTRRFARRHAHASRRHIAHGRARTAHKHRGQHPGKHHRGKHHAHSLTLHLHLHFKPNHGKPLTKQLTVKLR